MGHPELDLRPQPRRERLEPRAEPLQRRRTLVCAEESIERQLREAQVAIESRAMELPAGAMRGLMLELAGQVLSLRGRLERLATAA